MAKPSLILIISSFLYPNSLDNFKKFSVMQGKIIFSNTSAKKFYVDLGLHSPNVCDAVVSDKLLHAQLTDGKKIPHNKLVDLFCLYDNFPLQVKPGRLCVARQCQPSRPFDFPVGKAISFRPGGGP